MPAAFFVVRATVIDPARRAAFDKWYQDEHLPDATISWGVRKRGAAGGFPIRRCIRRPISSKMRPRSIAR